MGARPRLWPPASRTGERLAKVNGCYETSCRTGLRVSPGILVRRVEAKNRNRIATNRPASSRTTQNARAVFRPGATSHVDNFISWFRPAVKRNSTKKTGREKPKGRKTGRGTDGKTDKMLRPHAKTQLDDHFHAINHLRFRHFLSSFRGACAAREPGIQLPYRITGFRVLGLGRAPDDGAYNSNFGNDRLAAEP